MTAVAASYLLDTNVLLRLSRRVAPEFQSLRVVLNHLKKKQCQLCYTPQNLVEFWNVSTRPIEKNGHGLSIPETEIEARNIEKAFVLLPDTQAIHQEWRRLVVALSISGVQVHDARLAACMRVHGHRPSIDAQCS